jgi:hypothetical protein
VQRVSLRELAIATRTADALVYTVGICGVVAGGLLLRDGALGFAVVAWVLTFVAGATLRLISAITRGIADLKSTLERPDDPPPQPTPPSATDDPPYPYRRWSGWH